MNIDKDYHERRYKNFKTIVKESNVFQDYMIKCKCSHTVLFTGMKDRIICTHCGNYVYKDKKTEMKYKMKELLK